MTTCRLEETGVLVHVDACSSSSRHKYNKLLQPSRQLLNTVLQLHAAEPMAPHNSTCCGTFFCHKQL